MTKAPSIKLRRHVQPLSEQETDELVCAMADLFVAYVKGHGGGKQRPPGKPEATRASSLRPPVPRSN